MILKSILNDWKELKKERKKIKINSGAAQAHFEQYDILVIYRERRKFMRYGKNFF